MGERELATRQPIRPVLPLQPLIVLVAVMVVVGAVAAPIAFTLDGIAGIQSVAVAWATTLTAGLSSLAVALALRDPKLVLYQTLASMGMRAALPLAVCLLLVSRASPLVEAGVVYYVLLFYLATLAADTLLLLAATPRTATGPVESS